MRSPTNVADFFSHQVDKDDIKTNLDNSFSWAQSDLVSPKKSQKSKVKKGVQFSDTVEYKILEKPIPEQPYEFKFVEKPKPKCVYETDDDIATKMEKVKYRLRWLEEQKKDDAQNFNLQLHDEKMKCKEELLQQYEDVMAGTRDMSGRVQESVKIVNYLRDENSRLRTDIQFHKRGIAELTYEGKQLEATGEKIQEAIKELSEHIETMETVNDKLNRNCEAFKNHLHKMKEDFRKREDFYKVERNMASIYESCCAKIVNKFNKKSKEKRLVEDIIIASQEGTEEAKALRAAELKKAGIEDNGNSRTVRNTSSIFSKRDDTDSDSISDSDSDSDSDDE